MLSSQKSPSPLAQSQPAYTLTTSIGSHPGRYTAALIQFLERRLKMPVPPPSQPSTAAAPSGTVSDPVAHFQCLETSGKTNFMGFEEVVEMDQPLESIAGVIAQISSYSKLFPGYESVELKVRKGEPAPPYLGYWKTAWEQIVPFPFVPNIHYEMDYVVTRPDANRLVYRYQLASTDGMLIESDGAILLERLGPKLTRYSEWDFYDAQWGVGASIGRKRLWNKNLEGLMLSDFAIAVQARHPEWKPEKARDEAEAVLGRLTPKTQCSEWASAEKFLGISSQVSEPAKP